MDTHDNRAAMHALAGAYGRELDAQLGTLSHFSRHAGENGRVHEHFLRAVLRRFLPSHVRVDTGFIAFADWTSTQIDLIVHDSTLPALFTANELVVTDAFATRGAIEVKTRLNKEDFLSALNACKALREAWRRSEGWFGGQRLFCGLYAANGMELRTLVEHFEEWARAEVPNEPGQARPHVIPDVIYVRGKYALVREHGMNIPYVAIDVQKIDDGAALLMFMAAFYRCRGIIDVPWWLKDWTGWGARFALEQGDERCREIRWSGNYVGE